MIIPDGTSFSPRVQEVLAQFRLSNAQLREISDAMRTDFQLGLLQPGTTVAMLPTFVPSLPDGSETGRFLAMDLSGTNLRVMLLELHGAGVPPDVHSHNFVLVPEVMTGTKEELFDFLVSCLVKFLSENQLLEELIPLGFVFSYPCEQKSLRSSYLLWWTKGFNVDAVIGMDVVALLEEAILRHGGLKVRVMAIMNDTVGQLAAAAFQHGSDCRIGVVVGNGCNASYVEKTAAIKKFNAAEANYPFEEMIVDTEWESFGDKGQLDSIKTEFDREIDERSLHKGKQTIDKLTGAYYLGELTRRVLEQLVVDNQIFGGLPSDSLSTPANFPTKYISEILNDDETGHYKNTRRIIDELQINTHNTQDYLIMREVCMAISQRAAGIIAAAIKALMTMMGRPTVTIGVGGTLYQYHPNFHALLEGKLADIADSGVQWKLAQAPDGSCRGVAMMAAVIEKLKIT